MKSELQLRDVVVRGVRVGLVGVAAGCAMLLSGCGSTGSGGGSSTPPALGGATDVYVISTADNGTQGSILNFAADAEGAVSPKGTLNLPTAMVPFSVATDSTGQIYVGGFVTPNYEILVYPAGAKGAATPSRTILTGSIDDPSFIAAGSMSVDASGNLYVVGVTGSVAIYSSTANGIASPSQTITSPLLTGPVGVAVDTTGNVYVSNETATSVGATGTIYVFAPGSGAMTPVREITSPNIFFGIAVDASSDIFATEITLAEDSSGDLTGAAAQIVEFSPSASGAAAATKSITVPSGGNPVTIAAGLRADSAGNLFTAVQTDSSTDANAVLTTSIMGFAATDSGSAAPAVSFTSSSWANPNEQIAVH